jgi:hypothetical protein
MTRFSGRARVAGVAAAVGTAAVAALVVGTPAAWASDGPGIHTTYCQTIRYGGYVTLTQRGVMTPGGGGLVCYTGLGTARIDHRWTTRFAAGTHAGALRYREGPGQAIVVRRFFPGQSENFQRPVMVESLTITS